MLFERNLPLLALIAVTAGCAAAPPRFPQGRPVIWRDDDTRPFRTPCKPDPEEPGHLLCAPETYESPFAWDAADNTIFLPLSRALSVKRFRESVNVNAWDEVPDSSWFENRLGVRALTPEQVALGPCNDGKVLDENGPAGSWVIDQGKPNGANPGFRVKVKDVGKFMLKADIRSEPERATAATTIAARIYWAAGFHTPCDSVVYVNPNILSLKPDLKFADNSGEERNFDQATLDKVLGYASKRGGYIRMVASRWLPGRAIGPFTYAGVREDDPNDVIPHEHRRDLRGARLVAAWLNHFDSREQNSMNVWLAADESDPDATPGHIRHYYLDFGDSFGSDWDWEMLSKRLGHAYYLDIGYATEDFVTLGLIERPWDRARRTPGGEMFNYFNARDFKPEMWRGGYPNPAFVEMTERDGAWITRIISRFSAEHLRAIVATGNITSPRHSAYLLDNLIRRQHAIVRRYFEKLSPLADFEVAGSRLCAVDLARRSAAFTGQRFAYTARVQGGPALSTRSFPDGRVCVDLPDAPAGDSYMIVDVSNGQAKGPLRAHLYDLGDKFELAGIERPDAGD
ncbi:MAG TPA: hypothetical protein VM686_08595 [Polyangiaceae bacterium]|nr:hypothetical protein [Polyangiaceae bacterium]